MDSDFYEPLETRGLQWELDAQRHNQPSTPCYGRPLAQCRTTLHCAGKAHAGWGGEPTFLSGICNMETIEQSVTTVYRKNCQGFIYWK